MKIAFSIFGGDEWTGGINYLVNLLSAIAEHPGKSLEAVLFTGEDVSQDIIDRLTPHLSIKPVRLKSFTKNTNAYRFRKLCTLFFLRDSEAEKQFKKHNIDLVFQHACWYGFRFRLPTLVWIGDFQHKLYPDMFSKAQYWKREIGFQLLTRFGTSIMTSSETGSKECQKYYPHSLHKTMSLPFVVRLPENIMQAETESIIQDYKLPRRFFYLPNQFWKHKNHLLVIEAVKYLVESGKPINIVMSGKMSDIRNPEHPKLVTKRISDFNLDKYIIVLGMIPYTDIIKLMRASIGVLNPSLYEGWSTTVEEAKSVGASLLLSDIPVHREQAMSNSRFYDPYDGSGLAGVIWNAWNDYDQLQRTEDERRALDEIDNRRQNFTNTFIKIASETVSRFNQG